jgi:arsenite oxidase small subunit
VITDDARTVPVGGVVRLTNPGDRDPALLLRLDDDVYVAYSVICTYLACEVLWERDTAELFCPCHNGVFDPVDGAPVAGPPQRPLPRIRLERRGQAIVAVGEAVEPVGARGDTTEG